MNCKLIFGNDQVSNFRVLSHCYLCRGRIRHTVAAHHSPLTLSNRIYRPLKWIWLRWALGRSWFRLYRLYYTANCQMMATSNLVSVGIHYLAKNEVSDSWSVTKRMLFFSGVYRQILNIECSIELPSQNKCSGAHEKSSIDFKKLRELADVSVRSNTKITIYFGLLSDSHKSP